MNGLPFESCFVLEFSSPVSYSCNAAGQQELRFIHNVDKALAQAEYLNQGNKPLNPQEWNVLSIPQGGGDLELHLIDEAIQCGYAPARVTQAHFYGLAPQAGGTTYSYILVYKHCR